MSDPERGQFLDVRIGDDGVNPAAVEPNCEAAVSPADRPWIGIHFECCGIYRRVYRSPEDHEYIGHCPKCARKVTLKVGPDGVASRVFIARPI